METITGIAALKDEWRKTKIKIGCSQGFKNAFALSEKFGINPLQTFFYKNGGWAGEKIEMHYELQYYEGGDWRPVGSGYTMAELVTEAKKHDYRNELHVNFTSVKWNKQRSDADRNTVNEFIFKLK